MENIKLCILAAGTGSRLGYLSENLGKALLPIGNTTALSKIINKFPKDYEIIIALGYKADLIKSYCNAVHFDRNITYVLVDNFDQKGSGPGYSLLKCKPYLNDAKFYLTTIDCLVNEEIPILDYDWIGVSKTDNPKLYSTAKLDYDNNVKKFINKNANGYNNAFIGVAFVNSPDIFWKNIDKYKSSEDEVEFVSAWYDCEHYETLKAINFTWNDTGSIKGYNDTLIKYGQSTLGLSKIINEHVFCENKIIVKICFNTEKNNKRFLRAFELDNLVPKISYKSDNLIAYKWVDGQEMYYGNNPLKIIKLLDWLQTNLWKTFADKNFHKSCFKFYHDKTYERYEQINFIKDDYCNINNSNCMPIKEILSLINFEKLSKGIPVTFHGDLQFQNIISDESNNFCLIDWRENFVDDLNYGDIYYDLSKLYACLLLDYSAIDKYTQSISLHKNNYKFEPNNRNDLNYAKVLFEDWILKNNFDLDRIKIISALIWINMSPLHVYPDNLLFYLQSKFYLNSLLKDNSYFLIS